MRVEVRTTKFSMLALLLVALIAGSSGARAQEQNERLRSLAVRDLLPQPIVLVLRDFKPVEFLRNGKPIESQQDESGYGVIDDRKPRGAVRLTVDGVVADQNLRVPPQTVGAAENAKDIDLQNRLSELTIADGPTGLSVKLRNDNGAERELSPSEYVRAVQAAQQAQRSSGFLYVLFNITRPWGFVWVGAGFLAQALFTYRMILQWWASEKHKRSIVPLGYWWGSLFGGILLFSYFVWRKDIVGYLGQSTGVFIYARNIALIYRGRRIEAEGARALAAGEAAQ
jgi:lipid-A-disaccharide synthase-like uncharacterized protein